MARLISYKVKDDSEYSTFIGKRAKSAEELEADSRGRWWKCDSFCCRCCDSDSECDDDKEVEFALVKYTKVFSNIKRHSIHSQSPYCMAK